jgi:hypothetical protein
MISVKLKTAILGINRLAQKARALSLDYLPQFTGMASRVQHKMLG